MSGKSFQAEAQEAFDAIVAQQDQFRQWCDNVQDNLSALICIVTNMAGMSEQEYKAIVLRCRAMKDQVHAQIRDNAAGQAADQR